MADEFTFVGQVADNSPYSTQKGRVDKRMVRDSVKNVSLDSGQEFVLLDSKERGDIYEVRVVSDNPYLEVYIEIDDWRNENTSAAELLAQPDTGRLLSNFRAIDGGSPSNGYTLLYNPDLPEDFDGRIRVVLRNRIRPSKDVFGNPVVYGTGRSYTSRAGLATPTNLGFAGGAVLPVLQENTHNPEELGWMMSSLLGPDFLNVQGVPNRTFLSALGYETTKGFLHPYVGRAGLPALTPDNLGGGGASTKVFLFVEDTAPANGLPVWPQSTQTIWVVDFDGATLTTSVAAGDRFWFKNETTVFFPGEVQSVSTGQNLPTYLAANGATQYTDAIAITVSPGLRAIPAPVWLGPTYTLDGASGGAGLTTGCFGTLTSQADTNPVVHVHSAEIRRLKRVSYDG